MYNVYSDDLIRLKSAKEASVKLKLQKQIEVAHINRNILANRHNQRLAKRFSLMSQNPNTTYYKPIKKILTPFIGEAMIRQRPKDTQQRVAETLQQNKMLDIVPSPKLKFKLRERSKQKEINPSLRFAARTTQQRVHQSWVSRSLYLESAWPLQRSCKKQPRNYFKSVETVLNDVEIKRVFSPGAEKGGQEEIQSLKKLANEVAKRFQLQKKRTRKCVSVH